MKFKPNLRFNPFSKPSASWLARNWHLIALLLLFSLALWVRIQPAKYDELQALDPFYMYRMSKYVATHGLTLPEHDSMRYFPNGVHPYQVDYGGPVFIPAILYIFISAVGVSVPFIKFAIIYPAVMGALAVVLMYFLGKELFDRRTGLTAAFFFAVIPAFITRTSAGFFEKESLGGVFILSTMLLFIMAYKRKSWPCGILSGLSMAILGSSWGGSQMLYLMLPAYALMMLLINRDIDRLLPSFLPTAILGTALTQLYPYHVSIFSATMLPSLAVAGILLIRVAAERFKAVKQENLFYLGPGMLVAGFVALLLGSLFLDSLSKLLASLGRYIFFDRGVLGSTVAEQMPGDWNAVLASSSSSYTPIPLASFTSIWIFAFLGFFWLAALTAYKLFKDKTADFPRVIPLLWFLIGIWSVFYMVRLVIFFAFPAALLGGFLFGSLAKRLEPHAKVSWERWGRLLMLAMSSITGSMLFYVLHPLLSVAIAGWLTWEMLALLAFNMATLGLLFLHFRPKLSADFNFLLLLVYCTMAVGFWYAFSMISESVASLLVYPSLFFLFLFAALYAKKKMNHFALALSLLAVFLAYAVGVNVSNAYNYGNGIGPSVCIPRDGEKCLFINDDGTYEFNLNGQPWYQAFDFLRTNTTANSSILSWWDFGYWFQTRANRPSIADGGNINETVDHEIAVWFTAPPQNWSDFEPWLEDHKPSYILMDYTLPGKYGAISRISSSGKETRGMQQFPFRRQFEQNNKTVFEFAFSSSTADGVPINTSLYIPMAGDSIAGTPQIVISHMDQILQQSYINDYCSDFGILKLDNRTNALRGCVAVSAFGVFFIPEEVEYTIFTSLMFMNGAGLPVNKVFDNQLIKIYETKYATPLEQAESE